MDLGRFCSYIYYFFKNLKHTFVCLSGVMRVDVDAYMQNVMTE